MEQSHFALNRSNRRLFLAPDSSLPPTCLVVRLLTLLCFDLSSLSGVCLEYYFFLGLDAVKLQGRKVSMVSLCWLLQILQVGQDDVMVFPICFQFDNVEHVAKERPRKDSG